MGKRIFSYDDLSYDEKQSLREETAFMDKIIAAFSWVSKWEIEGRFERRINNGTMFFLNTGTACFGVSAAHVILDKGGYRDVKKNALQYTCKVGDMHFDPDERLIDIDEKIDIATFKITREEINKIGCHVFTSHQPQWPPEPPEEDKAIMFAGYPGCERRWVNTNEVVFGSCVSTGITHAVNNREISTRWEREFWIPTTGLKLPPKDYHSGGMSGGPMIANVDGILRTWRLAGVVVQGPKGYTDEGGISEFEMFKAKRADYINADGTINRDRWE